MGIQLEPVQAQAVELIETWFKKKSNQQFVLSGLAGTGKTTIVKYFMDKLKVHPREVAFVAFTGKAALVLTSMGTPATTIHKLIYRPVELPNGEVKFEKVDKLEKDLKLIVVDEASMVNDDIQRDLQSFRVPIIYIGDHGQLPPVEGFNKLMMNPNIKLEKIHRQAEGNPIIMLAKLARLGAKIPYKQYGPSVMKVAMKDVNPNMLLSTEQILCGKNATRHKLNQKVRTCLGKVGTGVTVGDRVIFLRNNWVKGYINGMTAEVLKLSDFDRTGINKEDYWRYHVDQQAMMVRVDYNEEVMSNIPYDPGVFKMQVPPDMKNRCVEPLDYAYALTVHKAQGSQYNTLMLIEEWLGDAAHHNKWLYTGITRAANGLILVGR